MHVAIAVDQAMEVERFKQVQYPGPLTEESEKYSPTWRVVRMKMPTFEMPNTNEGILF